MRRLLSGTALLLVICPSIASACACGCGIFSVGTSAMFPERAGGMVSLEYDYMDQDRNWSGTSSAPAGDNTDKDIRSEFYTLGAQYMFNRSWGLETQIPYWNRLFTTADSGTSQTFHHRALSDVRVLGLYTGFSDDMSTGLIFGLKLPTGDYTYPNFDRDTSIGTGSTDTILGLFHQDRFDAEGNWSWFAQAQWQRAFRSRDGYRPGNELDAAVGAYYAGWDLDGHGRLTPVLQVLFSDRLQDSGAKASAGDSGYKRVLLAPGIEFDHVPFKFYADIEAPVYQNVNGNQLVARRQYKFTLSYRF